MLLDNPALSKAQYKKQTRLISHVNDAFRVCVRRSVYVRAHNRKEHRNGSTFRRKYLEIIALKLRAFARVGICLKKKGLLQRWGNALQSRLRTSIYVTNYKSRCICGRMTGKRQDSVFRLRILQRYYKNSSWWILLSLLSARRYQGCFPFSGGRHGARKKTISPFSLKRTE